MGTPRARRAAAGGRRSASPSASTNETNAKNPKIRSAQDPIDIGDQYLNIGVNVFRSIIMCQKRSGRDRSAISRNPHSTTSGNAT
jgi:hypothetical protein